MQPSIRFDDERSAILLHDPIPGQQYPLRTNEDVSLEDADRSDFRFPVDTAARAELGRLYFPSIPKTYVRDDGGELVDDVDEDEVSQYGPGRYIVEVEPPMKLYLQFEGAFSLVSFGDQMVLDFSEQTAVRIAVRSYHDEPAGTITITEDPADAMTGLSFLSSSLKTLSPERSFPTLRGYPPNVDIGEQLDVPEGLERPSSQLRVGCQPAWREILPLAPLAFYLGAEFVEHETPAIIGPDFEHTLEATTQIDRLAARTFQHLFLLDTVVRTAGFYDVNLKARERVEDRLSVNYERLYSSRLSDRTREYLDIDEAIIEDVVPTWRLTVDMEPQAESAEFLPYVLNDLGTIRTDSATKFGNEPEQGSISDSVLPGPTELVRSVEEYVRSGSASGSPVQGEEFVSLEDTDSIEHAWAGGGRPVDADKLLREGIDNRLSWESSGEIEISVVCNDPKMSAEAANTIYDGKEEMPFNVTFSGPLTVSGLRDELAKDVDFLHYIGHVDESGFQCEDGVLELGSEDVDVRVGSFFLNACQSYQQGVEMVRAGSIGGIVTLSDVVNDGAMHMGQLVARLLNEGFSLRSALKVAREERHVGNQYLVVGDGGSGITQSKSGTPYLLSVESIQSNLFEMEIRGYPCVERGMGSLITPYLEGSDTHYLNTGTIDSFILSRSSLSSYLSRQRNPVFLNGELYWSDEFSLF